jgi:hypothetical protein
MMEIRSFIAATKGCALLALLLIGGTAGAEPIGRVSDASGLLLAKTATGSIKVLAVGSDVERGETLFTRADTYARIGLNDQSSVALGPDTELSVETYSADSASLKLVKGRVRVSSGLLATHHPDSFTLTAGTTTVDVQHGTFIAEYVQPTSSQVGRVDFGHAAGLYRNVSLRLTQNIPSAPTANGMNPGLYVQVLDGVINLSNGGGSQNFTAGQFGFTPNFQQPPVILPANPGIQFTPPPSFSSSTGGQGSSGAKPGDVDCVVR